MASITSSFRITPELQRRLGSTARRLKKPKNALIVEALSAYLDQLGEADLDAEARRQSILVSEHDAKSKARKGEEKFWESITDTRCWR